MYFKRILRQKGAKVKENGDLKKEKALLPAMVAATEKEKNGYSKYYLVFFIGTSCESLIPRQQLFFERHPVKYFNGYSNIFFLYKPKSMLL